MRKSSHNLAFCREANPWNGRNFCCYLPIIQKNINGGSFFYRCVFCYFPSFIWEIDYPSYQIAIQYCFSRSSLFHLNPWDEIDWMPIGDQSYLEIDLSLSRSRARFRFSAHMPYFSKAIKENTFPRGNGKVKKKWKVPRDHLSLHKNLFISFPCHCLSFCVFYLYFNQSESLSYLPL